MNEREYVDNCLRQFCDVVTMIAEIQAVSQKLDDIAYQLYDILHEIEGDLLRTGTDPEDLPEIYEELTDNDWPWEHI